jgi:hypothetical protein
MLQAKHDLKNIQSTAKIAQKAEEMVFSNITV